MEKTGEVLLFFLLMLDFSPRSDILKAEIAERNENVWISLQNWR